MQYNIERNLNKNTDFDSSGIKITVNCGAKLKRFVHGLFATWPKCDYAKKLTIHQWITSLFVCGCVLLTCVCTMLVSQ